MARSQSPQSKQAESMQRIGHLSVLPVFFNLRGKPVMVIGGGEPAAWKAELLAQAGAAVTVVAEEICADIQGLSISVGLQGSVRIESRPWSLRDFAHHAIVVAEPKNESEAKAIFCAARAAGVPINIIDMPKFCSFQFGSIVNRSPVVVGISTDGAAPVLGQAIRTRIESVLPQTLAHWAAYAREIRAIVCARFNAGDQRRKFWANFSAFAFGTFIPEKVWQHPVDCIGKGGLATIHVDPADPEQLTLKSIRAMQTADIIYHDIDITLPVLDLARREAKRICIGRNSLLQKHLAEIGKNVEKGTQALLILKSRPTRAPHSTAGIFKGHSYLHKMDEPPVSTSQIDY